MKILIVDDERTASAMHEYYVRRLEHCTPVCFANPREALNWAATHQPDAVILDHLMPDIDGIEFTRRFRVLPGKAHVPLLMVTGCDAGDLSQRARSAGVNEFLTKPVNYIQLSRHIMEIYAARSAQAASAMPVAVTCYHGSPVDILIVDDEPTSSALNAAYVRKLANCKAVCFGNACDALNWAATHDPGIVIVDYLMPLMDGAEFTRRFRRLPGKDKIPVVMVTGFGDEDVREAARGVGVDAFLTKAVDRVQLSACILNLSATRCAVEDAPAKLRRSCEYDAIDTAELTTILAERDRMRALAHTESHADDDAPLAARTPLSQVSADILILDDERTSIAMLDHFVRKLNCTPARFTDPQQALKWCETNEPCAVIVDYMMPDVDGLEFTRRFRALPGKAHVPMLMVSAYADSALKQSAHDAGVNQFLHKPVDAADLTAHLRAIIAARALHRRFAKHERLRGEKGAG